MYYVCAFIYFCVFIYLWRRRRRRRRREEDGRKGVEIWLYLDDCN
jgi:hypothetical protein